MQPLYVTLFIMLRGYLDEFQIAGAKNATQQIRNRLGAPTRNVSSSVGVARLRRTRVSFTYVPQWLRPRFHSGSVTDHIVASKNSVSLSFHGPFAFAALDSCTNNGTNGYRSTVISPHFVRLEDHFWSLKWPILVHNLCKKRTNYGQNNANFAKIKVKTIQLLHQILYSFWCNFSSLH